MSEKNRRISIFAIIMFGLDKAMNFMGFFSLFLIVLKMVWKVKISWLWVFSPLWIVLILYFLIYIIFKFFLLRGQK